MKYFRELKKLFLNIKVSDNKGCFMSLDKAISRVVSLISKLNKEENKVIFIGNGGSASIANHITTDLLKNAEVPALAFCDSSLITCLSNDLGYEYVFQKPIALLAQKGDILFSISSSGKSKNILNAAKEARNRGCLLITLSGFNKENPLRKIGDINFYLPSDSYGYVEIGHLTICHCIIDKLMVDKKGNG